MLRLALASVIVLYTAPALAAKLLYTSSGAAVHWEKKTIRIAVDPGGKSRYLVPETVQDSLDRARAAWNQLPEMRVRFVPLTTAGRPDITVKFCREKWEGTPGLLAHTAFNANARTGVVDSAVIYVNECAFRFLPPDEVVHGRFDLQSVITHELGHALGMAHSEDRRAIMYANTGSANQRLPTIDDRAGLALMFGLPSPVAPQQHPGASVAVAPTKDTLVPLPAASLAPTARRARIRPPTDVLAAMSVEAADGKGAIVYTGEPILLPPIVDANPADEPRPSATSKRSRTK